MAIYNEIFDWSLNKGLWIRDALKRLIVKQEITESDIDELYALLKKESGFQSELEAIPLIETDLPVDSDPNETPTVLLSIEYPENINALYDKAVLPFSETGLTVVYGDNGSGKSGYSRILKKNCWSRDRDVNLKGNIYSDNQDSNQKVSIKFKNSSIQNFVWQEGAEIPKDLNSIFIFDKECADIYVNNENPTVFKPIGLDILERLIVVFSKVQIKVDGEIFKCNSEKPFLEDKFSQTTIFNWYKDITNKTREDISQKLQFSEKQKSRLLELKNLLAKNDPDKENKDLSIKIKRYSTLKEKIELIQNSFNKDSIISYQGIQDDYKTKKSAYELASRSYKGDDPVGGIGSNTWRSLWEAARLFAITEIHPENDDFPVSKSKEYCVLCQQSLNENAQNRLERFNMFIKDNTSVQFNLAKKALDNKIKFISDLSFEKKNETLEEIESEIEGLKSAVESFVQILKTNKEIVIKQLTDGEIIEVIDDIPTLSKKVSLKIETLEKTIDANKKLIDEKQKLVSEHLELKALSFLVDNTVKIKKHYEDEIRKYWLNKAKLKLNTRFISTKIGEVLETNSIQEQHSEFIMHLTRLNPELADKIVIRKTRTSVGATYQKCTFSRNNESLSEILSEGEQKLISISNFISECTINGSKNSIVFDDPVTSLDQNYREEITKIICGLAIYRQIIVLSHDLNFVRLCIDEYKKASKRNCHLIGLKSYRGNSGIITDEIPYLAKNIQERIDTIRNSIKEIKTMLPDQIDKIEEKTELLCKRMRLLLEKSVEDILANRTIQRFSKNISLKAKQLSSFITVEQSDIDFLLELYGKYSIPEHDGTSEVEYQKPNDTTVYNDLVAYESWKKDFKAREKVIIQQNNY